MGGPDTVAAVLGYQYDSFAFPIVLFVAAIGAIGSVLGSLVLYFIAAKAGAWALKTFGVSEATFKRITDAIRKNEALVVVRILACKLNLIFC
jgi:membrane protein YqaA with SNARE-associated domain